MTNYFGQSKVNGNLVSPLQRRKTQNHILPDEPVARLSGTKVLAALPRNANPMVVPPVIDQ